MTRLMVILPVLFFSAAAAQTSEVQSREDKISNILAEPSNEEIKQVLADLRQLDLSPREVIIRDSVQLSNSNVLYVISHKVEGSTHYGAVIVPTTSSAGKFPVIVFATGGDGMHTEFDVTRDFSHPAVQFPDFLGGELDSKFIVVIPSFRGQQMIIGEKKYQSEGNVSDAFGGATSDALALLNVTFEIFDQADQQRIAIYGGSRGGTVALLASARDKRISRAIAVAAPTDMNALYQLYPEQFKLLFFNDLLAGKITESQARKKFISISPIYFVKELPMVQVHHDYKDPFVPVGFATSLRDDMVSNKQNVEAYFYDEGIHGFWTDERFWNRVEMFIAPLTE